ncbi:MAG TPA: phosphatase PAP2 family protein [Bacillota bacterium]|nr:phosphatase PAP2 family protein [Bacillota bacterium]
MNDYKQATRPLFMAGLLFLVLFMIIGWGVGTKSSWVEAFDMYGIDHIQRFVAPSLTAFVKVATELGNIRLVIGVTVILVLILFFKRRFAEGLWLGGTILFCGAICTKIFKVAFDRDRPDILQLITKTNESFPSGHATATALFYGFIGLLIVLISKRRWKKIAVICITLLWILFIMLTRIYLGVHFPTDVVAGASFGLASALISLAVYIHVRHSLIAFLEKLKLNDESSLLKQRSR